MISIELKQLVDPNNEACCEYHLAHKVKEWALSKDYMIVSFMNWNSGNNCFARVKLRNSPSLFGEYEPEANTEPEAIFKAGNYILENLKQ